MELPAGHAELFTSETPFRLSPADEVELLRLPRVEPAQTRFVVGCPSFGPRELGAPAGTRTQILGLEGRCPIPLNDRSVVPLRGIEPRPNGLKVRHAAITPQRPFTTLSSVFV